MKKRILSVILALAMLACMIPLGMVTVSAAFGACANYSGLDEAVSIAESYSQDDYTSASWAKLAEAVNAAKNVERLLPLDKQGVVDGLKMAIYDAIGDLEGRHVHTKGTEYMTDGRAHWLKCGADNCPLKTVEDYEIAFSSYEGDALKETLGYVGEDEVVDSMLMGRQGKVNDGVVSKTNGRTIIGLTQDDLDKIGNKLVIVGCDDSNNNKQVSVNVDCAYTWFYDVDAQTGEAVKVEAEQTTDLNGNPIAAFVIIDKELAGYITGYGYYRVYNDTVSDGTLIGEALYKAPRTFKAVYDTTDGANTLDFYYDNVDHSGENKTVYENTAENPTGLVEVKFRPNGAFWKVTWGYESIKKIVKGVAIEPTVIKYKGLEYATNMFYDMNAAVSIKGAEYLDVTNVKRMASMFAGFGYANNDNERTELFNEVPDVSRWNTANVTDMSMMFCSFGTISLTLDKVPDVSHWNTANVTDMTSMFCHYGESSEILNEVPDVSRWNTANVTTIGAPSSNLGIFGAYGQCSTKLDKVPDVSGWNTGKVTNMSSMFAYYGAGSTKLNKVPDVSNWNTEKVTDMEDAFFHYAYSSTVIDKVPNVGNWNTGNVEKFVDAFKGYAYSSTAIDFTLDLSKWDVSSFNYYTPVVRMFDDAGKSTTGTWNVIIPAKTGDQPNDSEHWYVGDGTDTSKYIKADLDNNRVFTVAN